ncbi:sulfite exporter TauE/SafE family protein [Candidatus Viridilinea mediisalina]|nr:sulfite exporter TauE/SafE family protein [Candidatus Viridilinea mediisalina]
MLDASFLADQGYLSLTLALVVISGAALLGGISGFGFALISTPFMLLLGFPLAFIVPINLTLALLMRLNVAYRLREHIRYQRVVVMAGASIPGILLGLFILNLVSTATIKLVAGLVVIGATLLIWYNSRRRPIKAWPGAVALAGCLGGLLGSTTSLNGVPPVLLLASEQTAPRRFQAELALFFILTNIATLALLTWRGLIPSASALPLVSLWLIVALIANYIGTNLGGRLPTSTFRNLALVLALMAGVMSVLTFQN